MLTERKANAEREAPGSRWGARFTGRLRGVGGGCSPPCVMGLGYTPCHVKFLTNNDYRLQMKFIL